MGKLTLDQFKALRFRSQAGHRGLGEAKDPVQDQLGTKAVSETELAFETPHQAQMRSLTTRRHGVEAVAGEADEYGKKQQQRKEDNARAPEEKEKV